LRVPENFLFYLSAHESCTERLLARALDLTAKDVEISPDPEIVRVRKMVNSVRMEIHRMLGFVRLKPLGAHMLYGTLLRHRIGGYIAERFAGRNWDNHSTGKRKRELDISPPRRQNNQSSRRQHCPVFEEIKSALNYSALNGSKDRKTSRPSGRPIMPKALPGAQEH
jgi:hypothetical protein